MILHSDIRIGVRWYAKGTEVPWYEIYPLFLFHMLLVGAPNFVFAYTDLLSSKEFLYIFGGGGLAIYTVGYLAIFGRDEVKWMFINAALGFIGIYSQLNWLLSSLFGTKIGDYPVSVHVIPFMYFVFYTFLIRQAVLDITGARDHEDRKKLVEGGYIVISVVIYMIIYFVAKQ